MIDVTGDVGDALTVTLGAADLLRESELVLTKTGTETFVICVDPTHEGLALDISLRPVAAKSCKTDGGPDLTIDHLRFEASDICP